ncbi:MAG TPA: PadR family transcriptional regulator [Gemmatimonadaceae bacterium]
MPGPTRSPQDDLLKGTLDMLVLRTLTVQPMHGYAIAQHIERLSDGVFAVEQGSLYPALQRLEQRGWIESEWQVTENNRRARYYRITAAGRTALGEEVEHWRRYVDAVGLILRTS